MACAEHAAKMAAKAAADAKRQSWAKKEFKDFCADAEKEAGAPVSVTTLFLRVLGVSRVGSGLHEVIAWKARPKHAVPHPACKPEEVETAPLFFFCSPVQQRAILKWHSVCPEDYCRADL